MTQRLAAFSVLIILAAAIASAVPGIAASPAAPYTLAWFMSEGQCTLPLPVGRTADGAVDLFLALVPRAKAKGLGRYTLQRVSSAPQERWSFRNETGPRSYGAPVLAKGNRGAIVLLGAEDGNVRAIFAADGAPVWQRQLPGPVRSAAAVADVNADGTDEVVVGCEDGRLYCLSISGEILWAAALGGSVSGSPGLADVDGDGKWETFVGSANGFVWCLSGTRGAVRWRFKTAWSVTGAPVIGDLERRGRNVVLIGSDDGNLYCLDATSGQPVWRWATKAPVVGSPAVADVVGDQSLEVVLGSDDLYCLSSQGLLLWRYSDGRRFMGSPVVADLEGFGRASVIAGSDDLLCLDAATGELRWEWAFPDESLFDPILVDLNGDGTLELVVSSTDGRLWCFAPLPGTPPQIPLWIRPRADAQNTGNIARGIAYAATRGIGDSVRGD